MAFSAYGEIRIGDFVAIKTPILRGMIVRAVSERKNPTAVTISPITTQELVDLIKQDPDVFRKTMELE